MSVRACAALLERADPDRFRAAMAAPVPSRRILFPIYAFNVEVSRAPWVTQEPMIAEMRLQWWRDALDEIANGGPVRKHDVVDALAAVLDPDSASLLDTLVAARRWDIYKDPFEDEAHFDSYIDATSGALMRTSARLLGQADATVVSDFGFAAGVAQFLLAVPELESRGRIPLLDGTPDGVRALAQRGLERLQKARDQRHRVDRVAGTALVSGWRTAGVLRAAVAAPSRVADGLLRPGPLRDQVQFTKSCVLGWWL